jgi:hypothetical protein
MREFHIAAQTSRKPFYSKDWMTWSPMDFIKRGS